MCKEKPVKVLVIMSQLNRGGMENRLMDILRKNDFDKIQMDIYTYHLEPGVFDEEAKKLGSVIYYNKTLTIKNMFQYVYYFRDFLLEHPEYQIVHAYQDAWCSVFCKGAKLAGVPVRIAHSRTAISTITLKNICKNIIKYPCRKSATHFFAVSDKAGEWLFGKKKMASGQVQIWKNAIDCEKFRFNLDVRQKMREEIGISDGEVTIMHVGNFTLPKNHPFIIDVFEEYQKRNARSILVLVGSDTPVEHNMEHIKQIVNEKGLQKKVIFLGTRKDIPELLQAADVFLFPSLFEGFPGGVLEAQAAGLPCIISDRITKEVMLLDSTKMYSLETPITEWAKEIEQLSLLERKDEYQSIVDQGFDSTQLVEELTDWYLTC